MTTICDSAALVLLTAATQPPRLWRAQLLRLVPLEALISVSFRTAHMVLRPTSSVTHTCSSGAADDHDAAAAPVARAAAEANGAGGVPVYDDRHRRRRRAPHNTAARLWRRPGEQTRHPRF